MATVICVGCQVEYRPLENGVLAVAMDASGEPEYAHHADLWACPGCGAQIIQGLGREPVMGRWHEDFHSWLETQAIGGFDYWLNLNERDKLKGS